VPNPSSDLIDVIVSNGTMSKVSITTIDGKVVYEQNVESAVKKQIDVSRYSNGIYIINVILDNDKVLMEKLIKN
jgi:hypothetical protein